VKVQLCIAHPVTLLSFFCFANPLFYMTTLRCR